jgi:predicted PurR-regulated permease PerM
MLGIDGRAARAVWTGALVLITIYAVWLIRSTLVVFAIALLFAYLLFPLVDFISRRFPAGSRTLALTAAYALATAIIVLLIASVGTRVAREARTLASNPPDVRAYLDTFRGNHPGLDPFVEAAEGLARDNLDIVVQKAPGVVVRLVSVSGSLIYIVLVPILSFFLLRDGVRIRDALIEMLPLSRAAADILLADIHKLLLQYMRALLYLCGTTLITFSIFLSAIGVPYALLLASIAFALEFVPLAGPLTAAITIAGVSLLSGYPHMVWLIVFLGIYRLFLDYVLSPQLMSEGVEIHPLLVIFGILAGNEIAGVTGMFLSIPALALARLAYHRLNARVRTVETR